MPKKLLALAIVYVAVFLVDIVTGREDWPFGSYSMFSRVTKRETFSRYYVHGVRSGIETSLQGNRSVSYSFEGRDPEPLNKVLSRFSRYEDRGKELLEAYLRRYPDFERMRLYRVTWNPQGSRRDLVMEVP